MSTTPEIPPIISPHQTITYEITRWDIFVHWMTVLLRNRLLQVFVLVIFFINAGLVLLPKLAVDSPLGLIFDVLFYVFGFFGVLIVCQAVLGLATAYLLKHRGVLGRHILEITDQGLIERTDCNETLHRWPSIGRIVPLFGYLFIYVSDTNSHVVPKRCFSPSQIESFEADLRWRMGKP